MERGVPYPITYEGHNPPHADDASKAKSEDKKPDFHWGMIDHTEIDPMKCERQFTIECKRLGSPPSPSWVLTKNYIQNGILRFFRENDGYGKGAASGAMIGYVQDMEFDNILKEVNEEAAQNSISELAISPEGWRSKKVSRLRHKFERRFAISPFSLSHLWIDLRDIYRLN
jgi:hypothetical protein